MVYPVDGLWIAEEWAQMGLGVLRLSHLPSCLLRRAAEKPSLNEDVWNGSQMPKSIHEEITGVSEEGKRSDA